MLQWHPITDQPEKLTGGDIRFLFMRVGKRVLWWTVGLVAFTLIAFGYKLSGYQLALALSVWAIVSALIMAVAMRDVRGGQKFITRGQVSELFQKREAKRDEPAGRHYMLRVNGKLFTVPYRIFRLYTKHDVVEIHYLKRGVIIRHLPIRH